MGKGMYALAAAIVVFGVCVGFGMILPPAIMNAKSPVVSHGGTSLVKSTSNGQAELYSLSGVNGYGYLPNGDSLMWIPIGWQSDTDRLAVVSSAGLDSINILAAEYRRTSLLSTAGTELFEVNYRLYFGAFGTPNITGVVTIIFSMPDSFLSASPGLDGSTVVNASPVFAAACNGANNADGLPVDKMLSFVYAGDGTGFGNPGSPVLFVRYNYAPYSVFGVGIQCEINFMAPVPQ